MTLALPPVNAAENSVEGYVNAKGDSVWETGSGECLRTRYQDTTEYHEDCGYKLVVKKAAVVESTPTGTAVTVGGAARATGADL